MFWFLAGIVVGGVVMFFAVLNNLKRAQKLRDEANTIRDQANALKVRVAELLKGK
jgi:TRAP-type C4-dicarboxylate transport system permease small subunit